MADYDPSVRHRRNAGIKFHFGDFEIGSDRGYVEALLEDARNWFERALKVTPVRTAPSQFLPFLALPLSELSHA